MSKCCPLADYKDFLEKHLHCPILISITMIIFSLFFQNEKVADTKSRLQQLMINTPQTQDKSLLIQTVALFEALLGKIHQLQEENDTLKTTLESNKEVEELSKERDQIIFELEATRNKLEDSNKVLLLFQIRSLYVQQVSHDLIQTLVLELHSHLICF